MTDHEAEDRAVQRRFGKASPTTRREVLRYVALSAAAGLVPAPFRLLAAESPAAGLITKPIPGTRVRLPVIGMGSWITFDVAPLERFLEPRVEVLREFFAAGGAVIDSSPMYGRSEEVIGRCLARVLDHENLFAATKVWTPLAWHGRRQVEASEELWGVRPFDLLQIHNMLSWEAHLETLRELKAAGKVRFIGITTSHGRRHAAMAQVLAAGVFDFVQLTYNLLDREAEERLLPLAAEHGLAVIANRPFRRGDLIARFGGQPLPPWAAEIDCATWPQLLLKFVVSHPAVTCAIPATSRPDHMRENMVACRGRLPDAAMRERLVRYVAEL